MNRRRFLSLIPAAALLPVVKLAKPAASSDRVWVHRAGWLTVAEAREQFGFPPIKVNVPPGVLEVRVNVPKGRRAFQDRLNRFYRSLPPDQHVLSFLRERIGGAA